MKKVCINFSGLPKNIDKLLDTYNTNIYSQEYEYHILYTTWVTEDVSKFREALPFAYIKQIERPDSSGHSYYDEYLYICNNYNYDRTNIASNKLFFNYFLGQFIRDQSRHTIIEYEKIHTIQFDIIITTRPDIKINDSNISIYFNQILENKKRALYVANSPIIDIYNCGSYPDALIMGQREHMLYLLDYAYIIRFCALYEDPINKNIIHPETTSYKITQHKNIPLINLEFFAFVYQ